MLSVIVIVGLFGKQQCGPWMQKTLPVSQGPPSYLRIQRFTEVDFMLGDGHKGETSI